MQIDFQEYVDTHKKNVEVLKKRCDLPLSINKPEATVVVIHDRSIFIINSFHNKVAWNEKMLDVVKFYIPNADKERLNQLSEIREKLLDQYIEDVSALGDKGEI